MSGPCTELLLAGVEEKEKMVLHSMQFGMICQFNVKDSIMNYLLVNLCLVISVHLINDTPGLKSELLFFQIKIPFIFDPQPFLLWGLAAVVWKYDFLVVSIPVYH